MPKKLQQKNDKNMQQKCKKNQQIYRKNATNMHKYIFFKCKKYAENMQKCAVYANKYEK